MAPQARRRTYRRIRPPAQSVLFPIALLCALCLASAPPVDTARQPLETTLTRTPLVDIALIENNAKVGAEVAREMAKVAHASTMSAYMPAVPSASPSPSTSPTPPSAPAHAQAGPVTVQVFGSAAIDITTRPSIPLQPGTTTPGSITLTPGGVGRNIAEAAQNLLPAGAVQLVSTVGAEHCEVAAPETEVDGFGKVLMAEMSSAGLRTDGLLSRGGYRTAGCTLSLGMEGDLNDGVADMGIIESLDPATVSRPLLPFIWILLDCWTDKWGIR